jgi:chemotaxis protein MotB
MNYKMLAPALGIAFFGLVACGPSKKLKSARADVDRLNGEVAQLNSKISDYEKQVGQLKTENTAISKEAADCKAANAAVTAKMNQLNKALEEQATSMQEIRRKMAEALNKFENAGIDVTYKNGLVYVSMQDKLLFKSGSAILAKEGKEALSVVSSVLNDNPNVKVIVSGNTDTVPIKKGFKDNWSLSTERANSIVRILRDDYSVDPARLTAAGKSQYDPVADNLSPEGRAKNRRTDIILNPDLSKLWELVDQAAVK